MRLARWIVALVVTALAVAGVPAVAFAAPAPIPAPAATPVQAAGGQAAGGQTRQVCSAPAEKGRMQCMSVVHLRSGMTPKAAGASPDGYGPSDIRSAYNLPASGGDGMTVAIVDAFDDPTAEADLAAYRAQYGLPACTTANGCFRKISQRGDTDEPPADASWAVEISLDLDAVSSACSNCHLLLVEADDNSTVNLGVAVDQAVTQGAEVVSNSYGGEEDPTQLDIDAQYFDHPGTAIVASSGDERYGAQYPAASQYVTSVGGTSLLRDPGTGRGWTESVWDSHGGGPGSGCSRFDPKPAWQNDSGCDMRAIADVSAVADPDTGLAVYDSFQQTGWMTVGGTSLAAPVVAGVYALAGRAGSGDIPASYAYEQSGALNDVTEGSNGTCSPAYLCTAGAGYDGPTGLGTPNGVAAFQPLGPHGELTGTVTDAATGDPISGATVSAAKAADTTDARGQFDLTVPVGSYDLTATRFGYDTQHDTVTVADGATATRDFALNAQPQETVSGTVREGSDHGWPLAATLTVDGMPDGTFHTDPVTGHYSMSLPAGATYQVRVSGDYPGLTAQTASVAVGTSSTTEDFRVPIDPYACTAPGYQAGTTRAIDQQTFDGTTAPDGWTVQDAAGDDEVWGFGDPTGSGNRTGGSGGYAGVYSLGYGDGQQDTSLVSAPVDLSGTTSPAVWFATDYETFGSAVAEVDYSVDGGATWTDAWRQTTSNLEKSQVMVPLQAAAGKSDVQVRFHYRANLDDMWQVDDVVVGDRVCSAQPGGLVLGHVKDRNTGSTLAGATVTAAGGSGSTTSVADGAYWRFSAPGPQSFSATMTRYTDQTQTTTVAQDTTNVADFSLAAGRLSLAQTAVSATAPLGGTATKTVTVTNTGTAPATIDLSESPTGTAPAAIGRGAATQERKGHFSPDTPAKAAKPGKAVGSAKPGADPAASATASPDALPWTTVADYPSAIGYGAAGYHDGTVYVVGGDSTLGTTRNGYALDPATGAWTAIAAMPNPRAAPSADFVGGRFYVAGGWAQTGQVRADMDVYDAASDTWTSGPALPNPVAAAGTAVLGGQLYLVGGCQSSCGKKFVQRFDPATGKWTQLANYPVNASWTACGAIGGKLYCAGGASDNGGGPGAKTYGYDPATNTWTALANLPIDLWGSASTVADGRLMVSGGVTSNSSVVTNRGFAFDPATNTWTALPNANQAVYGSASTCGLYAVGGLDASKSPTKSSQLLPGYAACDTDDPVPWMSATGSGTTLQPGSSVTLTVSVNAAAVTQPGTYAAVLDVRNDTPYATGTVGVTMAVTPPSTWGEITGTVTGKQCTAGSAPLPGATVVVAGKVSGYTLRTDANGTYTLWLDRANGTLSITAAANGWFPTTVSTKVQAGRTTVANLTLDRTGC
ncbi:Kelch motif-containing protein [Actinacidiphila yanglinensis]|uniref:Kelch motif-containing protein n=1 Tax=Actinacidiphila yanglinensis TaxID=310779 RepID=A0A1H6DPI3_9ACTN|nr:carboxypeptidase regulatory-like domain-containing protein [Actinacidiphila yanglinensis]SEG87277.1 Kelch motif-containing protein [Actinacidiphila yanglinensis]